MSKFSITFKDLFGIRDAVYEAIADTLAAQGTSAEMWEILHDEQDEKLTKFLEKWVVNGEFITIEFDVDAAEARVMSAKETKKLL